MEEFENHEDKQVQTKIPDWVMTMGLVGVLAAECFVLGYVVRGNKIARNILMQAKAAKEINYAIPMTVRWKKELAHVMILPR